MQIRALRKIAVTPAPLTPHTKADASIQAKRMEQTKRCYTKHKAQTLFTHNRRAWLLILHTESGKAYSVGHAFVEQHCMRSQASSNKQSSSAHAAQPKTHSCSRLHSLPTRNHLVCIFATVGWHNTSSGECTSEKNRHQSCTLQPSC